MSKNEKRIVIVLTLVILYLIPILVLRTAHNRRPEVTMVSQQHHQTTDSPSGSDLNLAS